MELEDRKLKEIEHSDRRRKIVRAYEYQTDASSSKGEDDYIENGTDFEQHFSNMKFYSISGLSFARRDALLFNDIKGKTALDYCCGNGEMGIAMAKKGAARVVGIDISPVAVENANKLAREAGLGDVCRFEVMDAENTTFANSTFDVIHEYGALHHLDLPLAFQELSRILKPEGRLICTEALRHNPLIHRYRKRTPHLRTDWEVEHILGIPEINSGRGYFSSVQVRTFHLAALAAVPFRKSGIFKPLLALLNAVDSALLRLPLLSWMAWVAVVEYKQPIHSSRAG